MKLTKAQMKILEYMGWGGIYYRHWFGVESRGHWTGKCMGKRPIVNIRSIEKLQDLGLIECHKEDWHSKYYRIADAGREYIDAD